MDGPPHPTQEPRTAARKPRGTRVAARKKAREERSRVLCHHLGRGGRAPHCCPEPGSQAQAQPGRHTSCCHTFLARRHHLFVAHTAVERGWLLFTPVSSLESLLFSAPIVALSSPQSLSRTSTPDVHVYACAHTHISALMTQWDAVSQPLGRRLCSVPLLGFSLSLRRECKLVKLVPVLLPPLPRPPHWEVFLRPWIQQPRRGPVRWELGGGSKDAGTEVLVKCEVPHLGSAAPSVSG